MTKLRIVTVLASMVVMSGISIASIADPLSPTEQVFAVERAFAKTMADRDLQAFATFLSDEAVFFSGTKTLHGRQQITDAWAAYFTEPAPPFSWQPDQVAALESGTLALSTGPVVDPSGQVVGRFNSIWRLEAPGVWKIVFDKGSPASPGPDSQGPDSQGPDSQKREQQ
jgi:ketosteroid isomerase-like protein